MNEIKKSSKVLTQFYVHGTNKPVRLKGTVLKGENFVVGKNHFRHLFVRFWVPDEETLPKNIKQMPYWHPTVDGCLDLWVDTSFLLVCDDNCAKCPHRFRCFTE